jgi:hypothetical protein
MPIEEPFAYNLNQPFAPPLPGARLFHPDLVTGSEAKFRELRPKCIYSLSLGAVFFTSIDCGFEI